MERFRNRRDAGRRLAAALSDYAYRDDVLVLGLPRGGVPVAFEVAEGLRAPLDVFIVRKLGVPGHAEYAMGALASGGARVLNEKAVEALGISQRTIDAVVAREARELERRERTYRGDRPSLDVAGRTVILVDDGLATGSTMRAAVQGVKRLDPARVVVAAPVAAELTCEDLSKEVDDLVIVHAPRDFFAVGDWYEDFGQTSDDEVRTLLEDAGSKPFSNVRRGEAERVVDAHEVTIPIEPNLALEGTLVVPPGARGIVLFAHGSGSSRHSPRNRFVATTLQRAGLATLLVDLLTTPEEESEAVTRHLRFDIDLLADRLVRLTLWLSHWPATRHLRIGYFGASTGAAAALVAAARVPDLVDAIVSRGGRPDLAGDSLEFVQAPTMLVVGGDDAVVLGLNRQAYAHLDAERRLAIVPGATHLFEEPGTLERAAELATEWFAKYLTRPEREVDRGLDWLQ